MGANGDHIPVYCATSSHSHLYRTLAHPDLYRRDTKANLKRDRDNNTTGHLSRTKAQGSLSVSSNPTTRTKKKPVSSSSTDSQLFPVDSSEFQAVNSMWAKQGRSQRGLELISSDLVGLKQKQAVQTSGMMVVHPDTTASFASVSVSVHSPTTAFVSMSPGTSTHTSTSCASSLPSTLFSTAASSSSSSASTVTVVCKSSPCLGGPAGVDKYLDACCACDEACGPMQSRPDLKLEGNPNSQSSSVYSNQRSLLPKPSATRTPVASSASPLHVLLDEARKDGICSAELAVRETSSMVSPFNLHDIRERSRSFSEEDKLRRPPIRATCSSASASAPPSPRLLLKTSALLDNFVSFYTKLPSAYDVYPNTGPSTGTDASATNESYPLLQLHHPHRSETYTRKFPSLLPLPRSPFRARSPPRHPTPRFRLVENKEYLRLKAVWNRLSDADNVAVDLFVDTVHDDEYGDGDHEEEADGTTFGDGGTKLHDLDCECGCGDECEDVYGEDESSSLSLSSHHHRMDTPLRSHSSRSRTRRRVLHSYPPPSQSLVDKQGSLHTGCELIVGVAIDGIQKSALGLSSSLNVGWQRGGSPREMTNKKAQAKSHHHRSNKVGRSNFPSSSKLDSLDGLSLTSLVSSSSLSLSSLSGSVRRTLDSFRAFGEGHAKRVGASARTTLAVSGSESAADCNLTKRQAQTSYQHQERVQAHAQDLHRSLSVSLSGPEGL